MKREWAALVVAAAVLSGCGEETPPSTGAGGGSPGLVRPDNGDHSGGGPSAVETPLAAQPVDEVVATVNGQPIKLSELQRPLMEAHGLPILLDLVQVDLARQQAEQANLTVTDKDFDDEINRTLLAFKKATDQLNPDHAADATQPTTQPDDQTLSPVEREKLLALMLTSQGLTRTEFELAIRRNAYLRKIAAPLAQSQLTDQNVRERFNAVYGEKAHIRYVRLPNMPAVEKLEQALKGGTSFEEETHLHAYDSASQPSSGELAFTRQDINYPAEFKELAFTLKPGEVSSPLQLRGSVYVLQMIELIPPKYANYDDYKDSVKQDLYEQLVQADIKTELNNLGAMARQTMEIKDPILRQQYDLKLRDANELREQLHKEQDAATSQPDQSAPAGPAPSGPAPSFSGPPAPASPGAPNSAAGSSAGAGSAAAAPATAAPAAASGTAAERPQRVSPAATVPAN